MAFNEEIALAITVAIGVVGTVVYSITRPKFSSDITTVHGADNGHAEAIDSEIVKINEMAAAGKIESSKVKRLVSTLESSKDFIANNNLSNKKIDDEPNCKRAKQYATVNVITRYKNKKVTGITVDVFVRTLRGRRIDIMDYTAQLD